MAKMITAIISSKCVPWSVLSPESSYSKFTKNIIFMFFFLLSSVRPELPLAQSNTMRSLSGFVNGQGTSISWNVSVDPCSWNGVTCISRPNSTSSVTKLTLSKFGLADSRILPVACEIGTLETLDVSNNLLSSIPDGLLKNCAAIPGLKLVNISWCNISGPLPSFTQGFAKLEVLDLSRNLLSGSIGTQLNQLVALKSLNLGYNNFSGSVPVKLGKTLALEQLQLSGNNFNGSIPAELADYKNLTLIDLSTNLISGNVPSRLGDLPKLTYLGLSANMLSGAIPTSISKITTLQTFAANLNFFSGSIPSGISRSLKNLYLSDNKLSGSIPVDFLAYLNLQTVDLSNNQLVGPIPSNVSSSMVRLRLGHNLLHGSLLPVNFGELRNLVYLELQDNMLNGPIPAVLRSCQKLRLLNFAGNKFSGELPVQLRNLKQLQVLSLERNNFVGEIPTDISQLSTLSTLNISWNSLNGSIPSSISNLINVAFLHLQGNNLSGSIPRNISNMNNLIELQLGNNQLSGYIPPMPINLQYSLNISYNLFEGMIPVSLSQLSSLEILDLSNNRFSGRIPIFLAHMPSLTVLWLNNNSLSGVVPAFGPNVKVNWLGNPGLTLPPVTHTRLSQKKRSKVKVAMVITAAIVGGLVALTAVYLSRRLIFVVHRPEVQPEEQDYSQEMQCHFLTEKSKHRSSIDFSRAKEAVGSPLNLVLKNKFSSYYKVVMPSGIGYFVKKLSWNDILFQHGNQENFGEELRPLAKVNCSNVMTPLAYMLAANSAYLLYEMPDEGSLFDVLHRRSGDPLDWASRCSIAVGIAQGLVFLHGCSSGPILLFDLTSKTIMLKTLKEPQIGEIELCKLIDPSKGRSSVSAVAGSVGYIPPEYAYTMRVTTEGNVYSFGVILLELLTGKQAVNEGTELAKWVLSNSMQQQNWYRMLDYRISIAPGAVRSQMLAVLRVALACINASSAARPKVKSVLRMLLNAR